MNKRKGQVDTMEKKEMLYEGKAKKVYTTEDPDVLIVSYKDDATAFNGLKKGTIVGKGAINNRMTNFIFKKLEEKKIPADLDYEKVGSLRLEAKQKLELTGLYPLVRHPEFQEYLLQIFLYFWYICPTETFIK